MDEQIKQEVKSILTEASGVRSNLDSLYQEYRESQKSFLEISKCAKKFTFGDTLKSGESSERGIQSIFKDTIDAVHYLGGGYPNDTSKGKLETRLAYLGPVLFLLKQLGKDQLVNDAFKQYGIKDIVLDEEYFSERFDGDFSKQGELVHCLERCSELQTSISANVDLFINRVIHSQFGELQVETESDDLSAKIKSVLNEYNQTFLERIS